MKYIISIILLSISLCYVSLLDSFYTESPLPETVHYTLRLGHGTHTMIPSNSMMVAKALADIEKELNIKIEVVDHFVYEAPKETTGLTWAVLGCKAQAMDHAKDNGKKRTDLTVCLSHEMVSERAAGVAIPGLGTMIAHVWQRNNPGGLYSKDELRVMSTNTIKHEIGHLLGCRHSQGGTMFWRTREVDYTEIGKFSNESIREVKSYHKRKKSLGL